MANAYSAPINYGRYIEHDSVQLIGQVQTALQQRYDANTAKVDEMISMVSNVPLIREEDKKYLGEKIQGLLSMVDANSKIDLTSNNITRQITNYISTAIDGNVKKQVANSQKIMSFQKDMEDLLTKDPKLYNEGNVAYAQDKAGYSDYISGKTNDLGNLSYNPYVDYKTTTMEKAIKLKQLKGDQEIETVMNDEDGNPTIKQKVKISGLTPEEIIKYFPEMLTAQEEKQMAIDGWNSLRGAKPDQIKKIADDYFSKMKSGVSEKIKELDNIINSGNTFSQAKREEAARIKKQYESDLTNIGSKEKNVDKSNPEAVGYMVNRSEFMNSATGLFSGRQSVTYETNEVYFKKQDLEIKREELAQKKIEHAAKMKKEYGQAADGSTLPSADSGSFVSSAIANQEVAPSDFYATTKEAFNKAYDTIVSTGEAVYNDPTINASNKDAYKKGLEKFNYTIKGGKVVSTLPEGQNKNSKAAAIEIAFHESGISKINNGYDKVISDASEVRSHLSDALVKAEKNIGKDFDTDDYVSSFEDVYKKMNFQNTEGGFLSSLYKDTPEEKAKYSQKFKSFIDSHGGIEGIKKRAKTDRSLLVTMKNLWDEAADNLKEVTNIFAPDPTKTTNKIGESLQNSGIKNYVDAKKSVNITTEDSRAKLINMLPQQIRDIKGNVTASGVGDFDPKSGMTIEKGTDYYDIIQDRGTKTDIKGSTVGVPSATARVYKGSEAYKYIEANTEKPGYKIDVKGVNDSYRIKPLVKPEFYSSNDREIVSEMKGKYNDHVNNEVKTALTNMVGINPTVFLTKESTRAYMENMFNGRIEPAKIEILLNKIEANFSKYKVELLPNRSKDCWSVSFKSPYAASAYISNFNDKPELNSDFAYVLKTMPQIPIMIEVVKVLNRDVKNIDKI